MFKLRPYTEPIFSRVKYWNVTKINYVSDEGSKFKAAQELSEHLEFIVQNSYYKEFLIYLLDEFLKFIEVCILTNLIYNHS